MDKFFTILKTSLTIDLVRFCDFPAGDKGKYIYVDSIDHEILFQTDFLTFKSPQFQNNDDDDYGIILGL